MANSGLQYLSRGCPGGVCGLSKKKTKKSTTPQTKPTVITDHKGNVLNPAQEGKQEPKKKKTTGEKIKYGLKNMLIPGYAFTKKGVLGRGVSKVANSEFMKGTPASAQQFPTMTPEQEKIADFALRMGHKRLDNPYADWNAIEKEARHKFHANTVPGIAARFSRQGRTPYGNSDFQGTLGTAGANLEQGLAALKHEHGLKNRHSALQELEVGFKPRFDTIHKEGTKGLINPENVSKVAGAVANALVKAGVGYATGGAGLAL